MAQEFKPVAIGGSVRSKAVKIAEDIAEKDYGVADMQVHGHEGLPPKVRYKDRPQTDASTWGASTQALEMAIAAGRANRLRYGSGLDVLQHNLKTGVQPDLIELSKRRSIKLHP